MNPDALLEPGFGRSRRGIRLRIGLFGRRNVGKSSLVRAITRRQGGIVQAEAGTTDPVEIPRELPPLGPVLFLDTGGIDEPGGPDSPGTEPIGRVLDRTDLGILVAEGDRWSRFEEEVLAGLRSRDLPAVVVFNKIDRAGPARELTDRLSALGIPMVRTAAVTGFGTLELQQALLDAAPDEVVNRLALLGDLIAPGDLVVLVVPAGGETPEGCLVSPQDEVIREVLDHEARCLVVRETGFREALARLDGPPSLVITDSQSLARAARDTPPAVRLTSFSILFASWKGDLAEFTRGTLAVDRLRPGDRILIAEACTRHPATEGGGGQEIPGWLARRAGGGLDCRHVQGPDFPRDIRPYRLVVHCGACLLNRREVLTRMLQCRKFGVPVTSWGLAIAHFQGLLVRALEPFPAAAAALGDTPQRA